MSVYNEYYFGNTENSVKIDAKNLDYAVQKFKMSEMWPEQYVHKKYSVSV